MGHFYFIRGCWFGQSANGTHGESNIQSVVVEFFVKNSVYVFPAKLLFILVIEILFWLAYNCERNQRDLASGS